ncbi:MAG TPA: hypothetical protein VJT70_01725 [Sphingomicrobium sp.]|nr:hypothetical protein [Sphingomicrobium sp.]
MNPEDLLLISGLSLLGAAPQLVAARLRGPAVGYIIAFAWLGLSILAAFQFPFHPPIHLLFFWAGWAAALLALLLFARFEKAERA